MSRVKPLTHLEVLIRARERIRTRDSSLICLAITRVIHEHHDFDAPNQRDGDAWYQHALLVDTLERQHRKVIMDQLDGCSTYTQWIAVHHPAVNKQMLELENRNPYREGRLLWLDDMIRREKRVPTMF